MYIFSNDFGDYNQKKLKNKLNLKNNKTSKT